MFGLYQRSSSVTPVTCVRGRSGYFVIAISVSVHRGQMDVCGHCIASRCVLETRSLSTVDLMTLSTEKVI